MQIKILSLMLIATNCLMGSDNEELIWSSDNSSNKRKAQAYSLSECIEQEPQKKVKLNDNPQILTNNDDQIVTNSHNVQIISKEPLLSKFNPKETKLLQNCNINQLEEILERPALLELSYKQFRRMLKITEGKKDPLNEYIFSQDRPDIYELFLGSQTLLKLPQKEFNRLLKLIDDKDGKFYSTKEELELFNENQALLHLNYIKFERLKKLLTYNNVASKEPFLRCLSEDSSLLNIESLEFDRLLSIIKAFADNMDNISTEGCPNVSGVIKFLSKNQNLLSEDNCELWIKLLIKSHELIL